MTENLEAIAQRLREAAKAYYETDTLLMSDADYDAGIEALTVARDAGRGDWPDLLDHVAAGQSEGGDIIHPSLMWSMKKLKDMDQVRTFGVSVAGELVSEPKLDGLAIRAVYRDGKLDLVATRGNGMVGENVTQRVRTLRPRGLPTTIDLPGELEVRGEMLVRDKEFGLAQEVRHSRGAVPFKNQRNAAAGILRKGSEDYAGILTFAAYEATDPTIHSYRARMRKVQGLGIQTAGSLAENETDRIDYPVTLVDQRIEDFGRTRAAIGFPTDGIILKADMDSDRNRLGMGTKFPNWAIAWKYEAETATTVVRDITTTIGKTGRMGIRVEVLPVQVGGATVSYASGHNVTWMQEHDIRVGDTVTMRRANDVIPYIDNVVLALRPEDSAPWTPPEADPLGEPWDKSTLLWRSVSPELSVGGTLLYAVSRDALDIEGIGAQIVDALIETDTATDVAALFDLDAATLAALPMGDDRTLGAKNAAKIVAEIDKARSAPWNRVITALTIRGTGRTMSRRLAAAFPTMDDLLAASTDDLMEVEGVGEKKAGLIASELARVRPLLLRLAGAGVTTANESAAGDALAGMTVVVSGSVPGFTRTTIQEKIESLGGKASSGVSASTSLLVSEPSTSSKYRKATSLGVRIVTPAEFLEMIA